MNLSVTFNGALEARVSSHQCDCTVILPVILKARSHLPSTSLFLYVAHLMLLTLCVKQHDRTTLNLFVNDTKNGNIDGTCKRSLKNVNDLLIEQNRDSVIPRDYFL